MTPSKLLKQLHQRDLHPPGVLTLAITNACNLTCCHCWVSAGEAPSPTQVQIRKLFNIMKEFAAIGGHGIRITGGEPLCHPHWLDIIHFACSLGFKTIALQTNAMLLNDDHLATLRELDFPGFSIQISLDGATAHTHDLVRGAGAFRTAWSGIKRLVEAGLGQRISVFFTEMRHNIAEIPELLDLADSVGIVSVVTGTMVLCGRAAETSLIAPPEVEQYLSLLQRFDSDIHFRDLYNRIGTMSALQWQAGDTVRQACCTFIEHPYLTPSGRLYPCLLCHSDEYSVTGVYEKGLTVAVAEGIPLWSTLLQISRRRAVEIPECRDCPGKHYCSGGCMGRAWGSCGNLLAADDRCAARRAIYKANT